MGIWNKTPLQLLLGCCRLERKNLQMAVIRLSTSFLLRPLPLFHIAYSFMWVRVAERAFNVCLYRGGGKTSARLPDPPTHPTPRLSEAGAGGPCAWPVARVRAKRERGRERETEREKAQREMWMSKYFRLMPSHLSVLIWKHMMYLLYLFLLQVYSYVSVCDRMFATVCVYLYLLVGNLVWKDIKRILGGWNWACLPWFIPWLIKLFYTKQRFLQMQLSKPRRQLKGVLLFINLSLYSHQTVISSFPNTQLSIIWGP